MNHIERLQSLRNTYFALRHGRSLANEQGLIVSHPEQALSHYGLSDDGRRQVATTITVAKQLGALGHTTAIFTSDFARARESAELAASILGTSYIVATPILRERYFGKWDGQSDSNYARVWAADALDPAHKQDGVESAEEVLDRATVLIAALDKHYTGETILLVSHGDVLQILLTAFERTGPGHHRQLPHIGTGEIIRLELKPLPSDAPNTKPSQAGDIK
jgi:probable phosphoglycerate mutase